MPNFFLEHLPEIFVAYGLSFLLLGVIVSILPKNNRAIPFATHLGWLSLFGIAHGLQELVDGERVHNHAVLLTQVSGVLCVLSFVALMEFARRISIAIKDWKLLSPAMVYGLSAVGLFVFSSIAEDFWVGLMGGARYFLGFPGALLSGYMLYVYSDRLPSHEKFKVIRKWVLWSAGGFIAYAVFTPYLGKADPNLPLWLPTTQEFMQATDVPIQLFRTLCAFIITMSFISIIQNYSDVVNADLAESLKASTLRAIRMAREQEALGEVTSMPCIADGDISAVARILCERVAQALEIERVSIWLLDEDQARLNCIENYNQDRASQTLRSSISIQAFKDEFDQLKSRNYVLFDQSHQDSSLSLLAEGYLHSNRITAKLDVLIKSGSEPLGVLMLEKIEHPASWQHDEVVFASQIADQIAATISNNIQKQLIHENKLAREAAESASRAKSEFLSSMSHELRTPLNAILGFSQIMETDDESSPQTKDFSGEIVRAGQHMLALVTDMIDLARIESGRLQLSVEPVLLKLVVAESLSMVAPVANKQGISLSNLAGEDCLHLTVNSDHTRLRQVLVNFLSNAIKYNRPKGSVTLQAVYSGDSVKLVVSDTGLGIPAEKQDRIFNAFDRLGREGGAIEGTGIGLVITKRIVEAMGGSIGFSSVEGEGSQFWVEFPVV